MNLTKKFSFDLLVHLSIVLFLGLSLFLLPDYGVVYDSPKNFYEGETNLKALMGEPLTQLDRLRLQFQIHGAYFLMLSELSKGLFHDKLGFLDAVVASHLILPLLAALFAALSYHFVKRHFNERIAFLSLIILVTYPRFFAHQFNNIKDIPVLIFFSLFFMSIFDYLKTRHPKWLYAAGLSFALCFLTKTYALVALLGLGVWGCLELAIQKGKVREPLSAFLKEHGKDLGIACAVAGVLILVFYMPVVAVMNDPLSFLQKKLEFLKSVSTQKTPAWNFYTFRNLFFVTPALLMPAFFWGLWNLSKNMSGDSMKRLLAVWLLVPLVLPCLPLFNMYGGIRLFLVFLAPFAILTALGFSYALDWVTKKINKKRIPVYGALCLGLLGYNGFALASMHPFQIAYFNEFAGGLRGAQEKRLDFAYDYSLHCYREGVRWINENAAPNANLLVINADSVDLLRKYAIREDINFDLIRQTPIPRNSYVFLPYRYTWPNVRYVPLGEMLLEATKHQNVYQIMRQDGVIMTIYHKP